MTFIPEMCIERRSHHFKVYNFSHFARGLIDGFAKTRIHWGYIREGRKFRRAPLKVFAASNFNRDEYRFHINDYDSFMHYVQNQGINPTRMVVTDKPLIAPLYFEMPIKEGWVARPHQIAPIEYTVTDEGGVSRLIVLPTGQGKSFISIESVSELNQRFVLVARPMFLDKWVGDILKTYDIPKKEILLIRGGDALQKLLAKAKEGKLTERVLLISNKTLQVYINNYERFGDKIKELGYAYTPDDFFEALGGGLRVVDEVHLDFHFNFKLDLYTHTYRSLAMTATLLSDDAFIRQMHELAYPPLDRYKGAEYVPYIKTIALLYQFKSSAKIRYLDISGKTYSHHVFEKSIMRDPFMMRNYLTMISHMVKNYYLAREDFKEGDKFIVFCASIDMCTKVTSFLKKDLPDLDIRRYVEEDPYENLTDPDGRVSTLLSAGTGVDIDQLSTTILTTAVNSSPANIQGFGRLRKMKDGRSPFFIYFSDLNNPKHMDYHKRKKDIIQSRSSSFIETNYGILI